MTAAKRRASSGATNNNNISNNDTDEYQQQQQHLLQHPQQQYHSTQQRYHFQQQQQQQQQQPQQQLHQQQQHNYQQQYSQHSPSYLQYQQESHRSFQQQQQEQHHQQQQQPHQRQQQQQQSSLRDCAVKLPLDILWLPKSAMRPVGPDASHTDCILVVGVSRPKLAVVFLTIMLISLFLTFHVLYDSAVYNIQAAQAITERHRLRLLSSANGGSGVVGVGSVTSNMNSNHLPEFIKPAAAALAAIPSSNQISHPMVFPSNRVHFPKTSRRLPQALIIGVRKCGTRALLEMLYLHPRIQKAGGEVHFFDRDENYMKGLEWYRKKMPHSFRGQITIEKSPSYFVSPEVPERVRAMNASIKLLLIVREPVTRAISDYTQLRSHAATATLPLADGPAPATSAPAKYTASTYQRRQARSIDVAGSGYGPGSGYASQQQQLRMSQNVALYSKASRSYAQAKVYDNAIGGGGGGSNRLGDSTYTTAPTPGSAAAAAAAAAQIASKSFEELAIFPNGTVNESYRPLTISLYHLHLHRWLEVFPREQLLVVNGDRLIEDPVSQLKRIETFLGIEHRVTNSHFYFNETKGFYCLRYDNGDRCLRETKGRKHPHVDPVVVSKLRKFFAEHNQRFYELVGEDLGWPEE